VGRIEWRGFGDDDFVLSSERWDYCGAAGSDHSLQPPASWAPISLLSFARLPGPATGESKLHFTFFHL
jgi:hypothetical protein